MRKRAGNKLIIFSSIVLTIMIGFVALMIAAVKHHRNIVNAATSEHAAMDRQEENYNNVYILSNKEDCIEILTINGIEELKLSSPIDEDISKQVADVSVIGNLVTAVTVKTSRIRGKVEGIGEDYLKIKEYGEIKLDKDFKIYLFEDAMEVKTENDILLNYSDVEFVISNDMLQAAFPEDNISGDIRVILNNSDYSSLYHDKVIVSGNESFIAEYTTDDIKRYEKDTEVELTAETLAVGEKVVFRCEQGKIGIGSITRNGQTPYYRGDVIVTSTEKGLTIINELSVENYLYGVVPSEMPSSYPNEALKAQAICARSFAYRQMAGSGYSVYGAHVDDSTSCQVYNSQGENDAVIKAVDETSGQVLMANGEVVKTYYYSTSCGSGASTDEVWSGSADVSYSSALYLIDSGLSERTEEVFSAGMDGFDVSLLVKKSLSNEEAFRDFIDNENITYTYDSITVKEKMNCYEADEAWYRWSITEETKAIEDIINNNLSSCIELFEDKILIYEEGGFISKKINTIGELENIEVSSRGESGIVTELLITGSEAKIKVVKQSAIRQLLVPKGVSIKLSDGTKLSDMSLLPSAFFYVEMSEGKVIIKGGGYGHGVGMSQNGAKCMADAGMNCEEILLRFYPNTELKQTHS